MSLNCLSLAYLNTKGSNMKKYFSLIAACTLGLIYSPAQGERNIEEPVNIQSNPEMEQSERHRSPKDETRELELIRTQAAMSRKQSKVTQTSGIIKKSDDPKKSVIRNIK